MLRHKAQPVRSGIEVEEERGGTPEADFQGRQDTGPLAFFSVFQGLLGKLWHHQLPQDSVKSLFLRLAG